MPCGVYKIATHDESAVYIGGSTSIDLRRVSHFSRLRTGKHSKKALQLAYNKGPENIIFVTLEECTPNDLLDREAWWINNYNSPALTNTIIPGSTNTREPYVSMPVNFPTLTTKNDTGYYHQMYMGLTPRQARYVKERSKATGQKIPSIIREILNNHINEEEKKRRASR